MRVTDNYIRTINVINYIKTNYDRVEWHRLCTMPNGNCKLGILHEISATEDGGVVIFLQSYATFVAGFVLDHDYTYTWITGTYSATIRKHISKFASEFAPKIGYQGFKKILEKDDGYKVLTDNTVCLSVLAQMQAYKRGNPSWKNPTLD